MCECAASLQAARALLPLAHWGAVLLDWQLPDGEGLALLPLLRARLPEAAVIVLTARDQITDRIQGLDAGADDYLVKPYDPDELLARLRAVERRRSGAASALLQLPGLSIDLGRMAVQLDGRAVELTAKLNGPCCAMLAQRPDRIHPREPARRPSTAWTPTPAATSRWRCSSAICAARLGASASKPCAVWATSSTPPPPAHEAAQPFLVAHPRPAALGGAGVGGHQFGRGVVCAA